MKASQLVRLIDVWSLNKARGDRLSLYTCLGGEERCIECFGGGNLKEKDHLRDLDVDRLKRNSITGRGLKSCGLG